MTTELPTTCGAAVRSSDWLGRIVCGDRTEILRSLLPESVDLTVTSPPYNCGKDYGAASDSVPWKPTGSKPANGWRKSCA